MKTLVLFILLACPLLLKAQENLFGKSKEEVNRYFKEFNSPLINSGESKGIEFDSFNSGNHVVTTCFYGKDGCMIVRKLMPMSYLTAVTKEINEDNKKIRNNIWNNLQGTVKIELIVFKAEDRFSLDYSPVNMP